ncbi:MAG: hypothetical protein IPK33_24165 [Gemmatimonadetes bacterium]|nr:hypothetical protein [Gemmatimonadota bacterium]
MKKEIARLYVTPTDYLPGRSIPGRRHCSPAPATPTTCRSTATSPRGALTYLSRSRTTSSASASTPCPPAIACRFELLGFAGLGLDDSPAPAWGRSAILHSNDEPYIFHFPDGNATIARLLVRARPREHPGARCTMSWEPA